jgi:hypothetical protein
VSGTADSSNDSIRNVPGWQRGRSGCAVFKLTALRNFIACVVELGGAAAGLAAATQLTCCDPLWGVGVSEAAEAELRAGLTQLCVNQGTVN